MMKRFIFGLICCIPSVGISQGYFAATTEYSTYTMSSMKSFQTDLINNSGITLRPVVSFPAYFGYGVSYGRQLQRTNFGFTLGYNTTAGRADYEDYSGTARIDQLLRSYSLRAYVREQLNPSEKKWPVFFEVGAGYILTEMNVNSQLSLGSTTQTDQEKFHSVNIGIQPAVVLQRNFHENLFFMFKAGYEYEIEGKMYQNGGSGYLHGSAGDVTANWGGLRLGVGVGIFMNKK